MTKGFFHDITLFDNARNDVSIARKETFGPVASVIGFDSDDEAIAIANDSYYGIYGKIHSSDPAKGYAMALQHRTGEVVLNGGLYKQMDARFGGYKRSGLGREYGENCLHEYTQEKSIIMPMGGTLTFSGIEP